MGKNIGRIKVGKKEKERIPKGEGNGVSHVRRTRKKKEEKKKRERKKKMLKRRKKRKKNDV